MSGPIVFDRLTHYYGRHKALDGVSLDVAQGSIYALLGRNGAGKTTALKCLLGFLQPTRGRTVLLGHDSTAIPPELRNRVGYVAEGQQLVGWMTVDGLMGFQDSSVPAFDRDLCIKHVERLGLPRRNRVKTLSRGMRAQLALSLALAQRPELMVLDDPAMGLDAVVRREFLETMIDVISEEGRTLLFTSHILSDVERVCDHVAILDNGVLRVDAPLDEVKRRIRRLRAVFDGDAPDVPKVDGLVRARRIRNEMLLTVVDREDEARRACDERGAKAIEVEDLSLEDLFIDYTTAEALR